MPVKEHDAIPLADVQWVAELMSESKVPFVDALSLLCRKHFSFFYDPRPWVAGKQPVNGRIEFIFQSI